MKSLKNYAFFLILFAPLVFGIFSALVKYAGPDPIIQMNMQQMQELDLQIQELGQVTSGAAISDETSRELESLRSEYDTIHRSVVLRRSERIKWVAFIAVMIFIVGAVVLLPGISKDRKDQGAPDQTAETGGVITPSGSANGGIQDPSTHSFASTVDWSPLKGGGASFKTHSLRSAGQNVLLLKSSNYFNLFSLAFGIPAVVLLLFEFIPGIILGDFTDATSVFSFAFRVDPTPYFFILLSVGLMFLFNSVTRIDAGQGILNLDGEKLPFESIAGFQVVSEMVSSRNSGSFLSHELNVILTDGSRKNLMDHGDLDALLHDGRRIAGLVGAPLWAMQYE